ncbi:MAG TPA: VanZ family protein [Burkholderiales bacterium]
MMLALVIIFSLIPSPPQLDVQQGDKLQHVSAYFALMCWFAQVYRPRQERLCLAITLVTLGVCLEFLQGMTGWRSYDPFDMAANASGVLAGWIAAPPRGPDLHTRLRTLFVSGG